MQKKHHLIYWALFDWANSSFSAIIQTFVFATYFTKYIASNETVGASLWGFTNGTAGLAIAIMAPILGAIADHGRRRKVWIISLSYLCIIATSLLWFATPEDKSVLFALTFCGIGIVGAELSFVFYNAMLPDLAPANSLGRWSGWGWSFGYMGGLSALLLALFIISTPYEIFHIGQSTTERIRLAFPMTGLWYAIFSLPLFLFVPDTYGKGKNLIRAAKDGLFELKTTLSHLASYKQIIVFLIARIFYIDGLTTLFAFGGVIALELYGMGEKSILYFGIWLNLLAGIGALVLAPLDDLIGGKKLILISLIGLIVPSFFIIFSPSLTMFWVLGGLLGLFVGPVQAASRSFMARIAPPHLRNEMFGFFAFSGKATAFLGPFLVGWITHLFGSTRAGISVILAFFILGFIVMLFVKSPSSPVRRGCD